MPRSKQGLPWSKQGLPWPVTEPSIRSLGNRALYSIRSLSNGATYSIRSLGNRAIYSIRSLSNGGHIFDGVGKPRIIGGMARGRELDTPRRGTRPSPSRLREALFDILAFRERGPFLDLYSGSGAIGLEAASRGWPATCVDVSRAATNVITRNARSLGLEIEVVTGDALEFVSRQGGYSVVFAAPPYPLNLTAIFSAILGAKPAAPGGVYVFQHPSSLQLRLGGKVKRYGSNSLTLIEAHEDGERPESYP